MDNQITPSGKTNLPATNQAGQSLLTLLLPNQGELDIFGFISAQSGLTIQKALETPQISRLNRESPRELAFAIGRLLEFVNKLFNLPDNKKFNDAQIALLATDIRTRYWFLKFDELVYVLREGVAGKWGKSFSRLDTEVVHAWFQVYISSERDAVIEQASYNQAVQYKKQEAAPVADPKPMPDHIRQELSQLRHKLEQQAQTETTPTSKAPELTQESFVAQFKAALPDFTINELEEAHREAVLKQNHELESLISKELDSRRNAA